MYFGEKIVGDGSKEGYMYILVNLNLCWVGWIFIREIGLISNDFEWLRLRIVNKILYLCYYKECLKLGVLIKKIFIFSEKCGYLIFDI